MKQIKKFLSIFISLSLLLSIHNLAYAEETSPSKPDAPQAVSSQKDTPKETPPEEKSISPSKDNNKGGFINKTLENLARYRWCIAFTLSISSQIIMTIWRNYKHQKKTSAADILASVLCGVPYGVIDGVIDCARWAILL